VNLMSVRALNLNTHSPAVTVVWVLFWVHLIAQPIYALLPGSLLLPGTFLIVFSFAAFSLTHALVTRGSGLTLLLFGLCVLLAGGLEVLSVATGFPFGQYVYNPAFGPAVAGVSLLVPVCWFMMGYPALRLAELLVPSSQEPRSREPLLLVPVAAYALTAWDLFLDPQMVRAGLWAWLEPPFYAGIPFSNYLGWVFTALLIFGAYRFIAPKLISRSIQPVKDGVFGTLPVIAYVWTWFGSFVVNLFWWGQPLVAVVGFVGMGVFAVPAALKLVRNWQASGMGSRG
jgi:uncharacterized membrane protein